MKISLAYVTHISYRGASLPLTGLSYTTFALPIILIGALFGAAVAGWLYAAMPGAPFLVLGIIFFSVLGLMFLPSNVHMFANKRDG